MYTNSKKRLLSLLLIFAMVISYLTMPARLVVAEENTNVSDLIISEYLEGSSNNKAIEIFNGTNSPIDLSEYSLELYTNGKTEIQSTFTFTGILNSGETFVICNSSANEEIKSKANIQHNVTNYNGDDSLVLKKGDVIVDSFGQVGNDPGDYWNVNNICTKDMTLVRKANVTQGDMNPSDEFDPSKEWESLPKDDASNLGKHIINSSNEGEENPEDPETPETPEENNIISILEARNIELSSSVKVKGIITFKESSGEKYNYTIQDESAALALRGADNLNIGDEVIVEGKTSDYKGLVQIQYDSLEKTSENNNLPEPKEVTIADILNNNGGENYESQRVLIKNATIGENNNNNLPISDESGNSINIYKAPNLEGITIGDKVDVIGICSQYTSYQIRVVLAEDITKVVTEDIDNKGPEMQQVSPTGNTTDVRPEIKVSYYDESGIDISKVTMTLDGTDVTAEAIVGEGNITFNTTSDLTVGEHTVIVTAYDTLGNDSSIEFTFAISEKVSTEGKNHYYGQIHSHTNNSDGQGTVDEALNYAKDTANLDFFAITDHSNSLDGNEWSTQINKANDITKNGEFIAFYGWEMTWSKPLGHMNVINTEWLASREEEQYKTSVEGMSNFYDALKTKDGAFAQFNHPGVTFGDFYSFSDYDAEIDSKVNLLEVGNGDGKIHQSGYFPSYEYYTMALDQGWHVSPTNNQDNHKKAWGTANDGRTVIIADDLSRNSLIEAVMNNRVYSTEDKNLKLDFEINGNIMGSKIGATNELAVDIDVMDKDSSDRISTIEIIGNGGKVVASKDFDSNKATWDYSITGDSSSYYYVRVTEEDEDIAVSAPIWVGSTSNYGMSEIKTEKSLYGNDEVIALTAVLTNNSFENLSGVKVDFYQNEISNETLIGTLDNLSVNRGETKEVTYSWKDVIPGKYTIYAVATYSDGKTFTQNISIEVKDSTKALKAVIDASHGNAYVIAPDKYADGLKNFEGILNSKGIIVSYAKNGINDEVLNNATLLVVTDPAYAQGGVNYNYTEDEVEAVKRFTEKGGHLLLTSKSDYGEGNTPAEEHSAAQLNLLLESIGANLRFNDDQVCDDESSYGGNYQVLIKNFESPKYNLAKDSTGKDYRVYSGSSVILKDGGSDENVDWVARANDTTYNMSNDNDVEGAYKKFNKGDKFYVAAAEKIGTSKVFIAGSTFISNFEVGPGTDYANGVILNNFINWVTAIEDITPIKDIRVDDNNDGIPDLVGQRFTVEGYVTVDSEKYSKVSGKPNAFFGAMVIQDETAGITLFPVINTELKVGQKVRVTGTVDSYENDFQLVIDNESDTVLLIDENVKEVPPKEMSTLDSTKKINEGLLVKVTGTVKEIGADQQGYMIVNDGSGDVRVFLNGYVGASDGSIEVGKFNSNIKVGDTVSAIGIASRDTEGARIRVRDSIEVKKEEASIVDITILHTNDSHGRVVSSSSIIGIDTIASIKDSIEDSLLVDAGDTLHGLPFATMNKGADIVELMKLSGYDLMTPGNHDFNYGYERLLELRDLALEGENGFDIISANVLKGDKSLLNGNSIMNINGVKVGFFGLTSPETTYKTNPNNVIGLDFKDPIVIAKNQVAELKEQGANIIIALAHIGNDESTEVTSEDIAKEVAGIDVIVDGHSHSKYENGFKAENNTLIVSTGEYEANLGKVTISFNKDSNTIEAKVADLISKEEALAYTPKEEVRNKIVAIQEEQNAILSEVIGKTISDLEGAREKVRTGETNLGNLITDAMLYTSGAEIAITNGGGIRASIKAGDITKGDVVAVLPFGNYIVTKYLTGAQIKDALEYGVKDAPNTAGQFPHVAGINYVYDVEQPAGSRIVKITINGKEIDMNKSYLVATNDFIAAGGDGYPHFNDIKTENEFAALDEALIEYINHLEIVDYKVEGRITIGKEQTGENTDPNGKEENNGQKEEKPAVDVKPNTDKGNTNKPTSNKEIKNLVNTGGNNSMYFILVAAVLITTGSVIVFRRKEEIDKAE